MKYLSDKHTSRLVIPSGVPDDVHRSLAYIHDHVYDETLTVSSMRKALMLSDNNFSTRFRHYIGLGLKEYIISIRLETAKLLLADTQHSVLAIAYEIGYSSLSAFHVQFCAKVGCSPAAFRSYVKIIGSE